MSSGSDNEDLADLLDLAKTAQAVAAFTNFANSLTQRRWAVRPTNRAKYLGLTNQIKKMMESDPEEFFTYTRMNPVKFRQLLEYVRAHENQRDPNSTISVESKFFITIRLVSFLVKLLK
jgi:hypothetical protein